MTEYMKVKDYAKARSISPWTVYRLVDQREIEFERFGRCIRIIVRDNCPTETNPKWKGM
jgi:excisionase family DNA binding protein